MSKIKIYDGVIEDIKNTIGKQKPEQGGILGMREGTDIVVEFCFDPFGSKTGTTYSPNTAYLNKIINEWNCMGIRFCGFIHSHPTGYKSPSTGDKRYADAIMSAMPEMTGGKLEMPILVFENNVPVINWYTIRKGGVIEKKSLDFPYRFNDLPPGWFG